MSNTNKVTSSWYLTASETRSTWAFQQKYFSEQECDKLIEYAKEQDCQEATILGSKNVPTPEIRKSRIKFLNSADPEIEWVYRKLTDIINGINKEFWQFDLQFIEVLQFTKYDRLGDFYTNHIDLSFERNVHRKLSFSVQLSNSKDYVGGNLKIVNQVVEDHYGNILRDRGDIILFPSFMPHEITPIISGARYSLVGWVCGPKFI